MEESSGREQDNIPQCASCRLRQKPCTPDCVFFPDFPTDEPNKLVASCELKEKVRVAQPVSKAALPFVKGSSTSEYTVDEEVKDACFPSADEMTSMVVGPRKPKYTCSIKSFANKIAVSTTSWIPTHKEPSKKGKETGRNQIKHSGDLDRPMREKSTFQVTRDGCIQEISIYGLLPGDVIHLNSGDKIPADRVFISGSLVIQEFSLQSNKPANVHSENPFLILSGAQLQPGSRKVLVTGVDKELLGKIKESYSLNQVKYSRRKITDDSREISTYGLLPGDILMMRFTRNGIFVFGLMFDGCSTVSGVNEDPAVSNQSQPLMPAAIPTDISDDLMRVLVSHLWSASIEFQKLGAKLIRRLAMKESDEIRQKLAKAGAIKPLILCVSSSDSKLQEYAVTAILNLSLCKENKELILSSEPFKPLVEALESGTPRTKANAACALFHVLEGGDDHSKKSLGWLGAIPLLVKLLKCGDLQGSKDAATALYSLCSVDENKRRALQAGIMKPLVKFMMDVEFEMTEKASFVLSVLVSSPKAIAALVEDGGIPALVKVIEVGWSRLMEIAMTILLQICEDCEYRTMVCCQRDVLIPRLQSVSPFNICAKQKAERLKHFLGRPSSDNTSDHVPCQSN